MSKESNKKVPWKGKTGGGYIGQNLLFLLLRKTNINAVYFVLIFVVFIYFILNFKATYNIFLYFKKILKYNFLKSIFSTYLNNYLFGKTIVDKFIIFSERKAVFNLEINGNEIFSKIDENPNKGAIILNSHIGNSEIAGYLLKQHLKKMNFIVYGGESATFQKFRSKALEKQNIFMIPVFDGLSHIFEVNNCLKNFEFVGMAGDRIYQSLKKSEKQFMGHLAYFPTNPFQLAVKMDVPILSIFVMQIKKNSYCCYVYKLEVDNSSTLNMHQKIDLLMQGYIEKLEFIIKKYPLQWYNFHKFWN